MLPEYYASDSDVLRTEFPPCTPHAWMEVRASIMPIAGGFDSPCFWRRCFSGRPALTQAQGSRWRMLPSNLSSGTCPRQGSTRRYPQEHPVALARLQVEFEKMMAMRQRPCSKRQVISRDAVHPLGAVMQMEVYFIERCMGNFQNAPPGQPRAGRKFQTQPDLVIGQPEVGVRRDFVLD